MKNIDGKYAVRLVDGWGDEVVPSDLEVSIQIVNIKSEKEIPGDEPLFVLRAKDSIAQDVLFYYYNMCYNAHCDKEHLDNITKKIKEFDEFKLKNIDKTKRPD